MRKLIISVCLILGSLVPFTGVAHAGETFTIIDNAVLTMTATTPTISSSDPNRYGSGGVLITEHVTGSELQFGALEGNFVALNCERIYAHPTESPTLLIVCQVLDSTLPA